MARAMAAVPFPRRAMRKIISINGRRAGLTSSRFLTAPLASTSTTRLYPSGLAPEHAEGDDAAYGDADRLGRV